MRRVDVLFSDLDRTILDHGHGWHPRVPEAFRAAATAGLRIIVATARSPVSLRQLTGRLGLGGLAICFNGGWVGDLADIASAALVPFDRDLAVAVFDDALRLGAYPVCYTAHACHVASLDPVTRTQVEITGEPLRIDPLLEALAGPVMKIMVIDHRPEPAFAALRQRWGERAGMAMSHRYLMEVGPREASKGAAVRSVAERLDVSLEQCGAVGDSENDLTMLAAVGYPCSVANGSHAVRSRARFIGASCDDGGVADVIAHILSGADGRQAGRPQ